MLVTISALLEVLFQDGDDGWVVMKKGFQRSQPCPEMSLMRMRISSSKFSMLLLPNKPSLLVFFVCNDKSTKLPSPVLEDGAGLAQPKFSHGAVHDVNGVGQVFVPTEAMLKHQLKYNHQFNDSEKKSTCRLCDISQTPLMSPFLSPNASVTVSTRLRQPPP